MSDVFILGAGFSKAVSEHMPVLTELSRDVVARLAGRESTKTVSKNLCVAFPDNIELWMTYLSQRHPWLSEAENSRNRATFLDMLWDINDVLFIKLSQATSVDCPEWFVNLAQKWCDNGVAVITLNYDTLVERCACEFVKVTTTILKATHPTKLLCDDLYPIPLTNIAHRTTGMSAHPQPHKRFDLFKLHGSTNWFYSGADSPHGETLYYSSANTWKLADHERGPRNKFVIDKVPFIVPPLTEKMPFFRHETVRSLWRQAAMAVHSAERIFVMGYSLPQTDLTMRYFLASNCRFSEQKIYVADINGAVIENFRFRSVVDKKVYQPDASFAGRLDAIPALAQALVSKIL
jgi:hypothetical protein